MITLTYDQDGRWTGAKLAVLLNRDVYETLLAVQDHDVKESLSQTIARIIVEHAGKERFVLCADGLYRIPGQV